MFCVVTALVLQNSVYSFIILLFSSISGDFCVYFITKYFIRNRVVERFKNSDLFLVLLEESKNEPFKTAFLTRVLFIPAGIKSYILAAVDNKPTSFFISGISLHCFFILESILVANELNEVEEMMTRSHSWSNKTTLEKISFLSVMIFIIFTVAFVVGIGIWAKQKISKRNNKPNEMSLKIN